MLAEINLLPQKQQKNYTNLFAAGILILILIGTALAILFLNNENKRELTVLEEEYELAQQQSAILQQQANKDNRATAVNELTKAIQWSKSYPFDFVPFLKALTKELPENGYFYRMEYTDSTSLNLLVQFETSREAAFYLSRLKDFQSLSSVKLTMVETVKDEAEEDTVPRYLATYELKLDKDELKRTEEEVEME